MKFFDGVRIIECDSIDIAGRDLIQVKKAEDFIYLCGAVPTVLKLANKYYLIVDGTVYYHICKKKPARNGT